MWVLLNRAIFENLVHDLTQEEIFPFGPYMEVEHFILRFPVTVGKKISRPDHSEDKSVADSGACYNNNFFLCTYCL